MVVDLFCIVMVLCVGITIFSGCQQGQEEEAAKEGETDGTTDEVEKKEPLVEYSVYYGPTGQLPPWIDNPDDVVTPYVEEKFNLKIKEVIWNAGMPNRLNALIASDSVPEVIIVDPNMLMDVIDKGIVKDLTDLIPKYMPTYWNEYLLENDKPFCEVDGRIYWVYKLDAGHEKSPEENLVDPYFAGGGHAPFVREDILAQCGYKFKPIKDIEEDCLAEGRVPTEDEMKIDPPIATPTFS